MPRLVDDGKGMERKAIVRVFTAQDVPLTRLSLFVNCW